MWTVIKITMVVGVVIMIAISCSHLNNSNFPSIGQDIQSLPKEITEVQPAIAEELFDQLEKTRTNLYWLGSLSLLVISGLLILLWISFTRIAIWFRTVYRPASRILSWTRQLYSAVRRTRNHSAQGANDEKSDSTPSSSTDRRQ